LDGDLTPSEVARKHAISSGQLYTWRQQLLGVQSALVRTAPQFAQVEVEPDPPQPTEAKSHEPPPAGLSTPTRPEGLIEGNRCERGTWEYRACAARLAELGGVVG
jgi:transposase-like protein